MLAYFILPRTAQGTLAVGEGINGYPLPLTPSKCSEAAFLKTGKNPENWFLGQFLADLQKSRFRTLRRGQRVPIDTLTYRQSALGRPR